MTLIQATKIIGLKVITLQGGKEIDTVKDVIYDPEENRVKALLIDKSWFKDAKIISIENISSIGQGAVIVEDEHVVESVSENTERVANIANDKNYLTKTKIITVDGDDLGNISDLYFSLPYGNVEEFEVSGGLISDLKSGRNTISISDIVTIGQDATIVKSYAGAKIESQNKTQGVQGVATNAAGIAGVVGDKAKTAWEMAMTKVGEVKEYVSSGNLKSDTDNFMESAKTKAQEVKKDLDPKIENFKERVADMASQTKDKAQDIGSQMKAKADEMAADIKDKAQDIKEDMSPKVDNMKEEARDMGSNMQYEAQNMVSDAKDFAQEKTNQATQSVQSGLKNVALGQYLKINIIGQDDEIIGAIGDLVTREIFDAAERNGQLNKLLANLSKDPIYL